MSLQILTEATAGQGRDTDFARKCLYVRASKLVGVEGGRKIHEFIQQVLVEGLLRTVCYSRNQKRKENDKQSPVKHSFTWGETNQKTYEQINT